MNITNFTTSWSDGLAFLALIHRFRPDLFDYEIVSRKPANSRLDYAFRVANKTLGIARLLDPEGIRVLYPWICSISLHCLQGGIFSLELLLLMLSCAFYCRR